jgi:hypothetical protein
MPLFPQSVTAGEFLEYLTPAIKDPDYDEKFTETVDMGNC